MNGAFWKVILSSIITASIVGGAIGLVQSNVTAAAVGDLKRRQERIEDKLDRLIERQNSKER